MKVEQVQKNAKAWNRSLNKLNESQNGQVQIAYKSDDNKKRVGYANLFDIEIDVEGTKSTVGGLLIEMLNMNMETLKKVQTIEKSVAGHNENLLIIKTDKQGFIKDIVEFNNNVDLVIGKQVIPSDFDKGYYYVENGEIKLNESRKLELYPDFI